MVSDYKKLFLRIFSGAIISSIIFGFLYFFSEYFKVDVDKATKALNSKVFGNIFNLLLLNSSLFIWDFISPGMTISSIMDITKDSTFEEKRNATYLLAAIFIGNAWVVTYQ